MPTMFDYERRGGFIYFIQEVERRNIKIGFTSGSPLRRLHALRNASSDMLEIVGIEVALSKDREAHLHRRFALLHVRNEWFRPETELIEYITSLRYGTDLENALQASIKATPRFASL